MLPEKAITEFIEIYEKKYGKKLSREEAYDQATNLFNFVKVIYDGELEERRRKAKLADLPEGYHLDDGKTYTCPICHANIQNQTTWYDKNGNKCLNCQNALNKKIIPSSVCHDKDSWYSLHEFEYYFNIKASTVRRLVKRGQLKTRVIKSEFGDPYFYIFLIKDNKGIIPPKPESYIVTDEKGNSHIEYKKDDISRLMMLIEEAKDLKTTKLKKSLQTN